MTWLGTTCLAADAVLGSTTCDAQRRSPDNTAPNGGCRHRLWEGRQ